MDTCAWEDTTIRQKIYVDLLCVTHMYFLYLGWIRGLHKSDPSIPRMELACHSSSEVSTVDLYLYNPNMIYNIRFVHEGKSSLIMNN